MVPGPGASPSHGNFFKTCRCLSLNQELLKQKLSKGPRNLCFNNPGYDSHTHQSLGATATNQWIEITGVIILLKEGREEDVDGYNTVPMRNTTCFTAISFMLHFLECTWGKSRLGWGLFSPLRWWPLQSGFLSSGSTRTVLWVKMQRTEREADIQKWLCIVPTWACWGLLRLEHCGEVSAIEDIY